MNKFLAISATILTFTFVGAGCGAATSSEVGPSGVNSAFKGAAIEFTAKDNSAVAKQALGADAAQLKSFTEYKFAGSGLILLVGEVGEEKNRPRVADKVGDSVKELAKAASLDYSSVGGLNDKKWFVFTLSKEADQATKMKVLGTISK